MTGNAKPIQELFGNASTQLIIPVYQRNYAWKIENCRQLFDDLERLIKGTYESHFFGSIVTAPTRSGSWHNRIIIDGQQRLTTISLLMLAAIKAVNDKKMKAINEMALKRVHDTMLWSEYASSIEGYKYKIVHIEQDRLAYQRLYAGDELQFIADSKLTRNFNEFYARLTSKPISFTFDDLLNAVERLKIIGIDLDEKDDPQLIFESLNSTGLALEEADKIRNYLLMSLTSDEQEQSFQNIAVR